MKSRLRMACEVELQLTNRLLPVFREMGTRSSRKGKWDLRRNDPLAPVPIPPSPLPNISFPPTTNSC